MLFLWFFKNCELIRDSPLWRSNFIPLVHDSIIIIGSRSVTYTFGSRFTYKRWVRVLSKIWILAFLGKYSNIVCWVSKRVNWSSHHILICLLGLNVCLLSFASDTIMASFRAQIGWKRLRKCENKSYHSVSFLPDSKYKIRKK